MGAGVQPGETPAQQLYAQFALFQICPVYAGDFQLATVAGLYLFGDFYHAVVVEVEAGYGVVGFRVLWLFFDGDGAFVFVELDDAETFRVFYLIAEYGGAFGALGGFFQFGGETLAVKDVVAQYQAHAVVTDEFFADDKGLGEAVRAWLDFVAEVDAELLARAECAFEAGLIFRGGDNEDVPDARQHEYRERVVDHGLVVHRQELFGGAECYGVQAGAGAACQDYSFHFCFLDFNSEFEGSVRVGTDPQSSVVYAEAFALIAAILYALAPVEVVEVPLDGFADAGFEGFFGRPAEFFLDFASVYGVAHVVAGAVLHKGDQVPVAAFLRAELLEDVADGVHYVDVLFFVVAADVVGFAGFAFGDDFVEGSCVVFHVEPVADLVAFAVDRERFAVQGVEDHQRDELFREVVGAVVVAAICDQYRQAVGALPGAYQMI